MLSKLQRLVSVVITGAMQSILRQKHKCFLRPNRSNKFKSGNLVHLRISQLIQCGPVMTMHEDWMKTVDHYDILYYICDTTRTDWDDGGPNVRQSRKRKLEQISTALEHTFQWRWETIQQYFKR